MSNDKKIIDELYSKFKSVKNELTESEKIDLAKSVSKDSLRALIKESLDAIKDEQIDETDELGKVDDVDEVMTEMEDEDEMLDDENLDEETDILKQIDEAIKELEMEENEDTVDEQEHTMGLHEAYNVFMKKVKQFKNHKKSLKEGEESEDMSDDMKLDLDETYEKLCEAYEDSEKTESDLSLYEIANMAYDEVDSSDEDLDEEEDMDLEFSDKDLSEEEDMDLEFSDEDLSEGDDMSDEEWDAEAAQDIEKIKEYIKEEMIDDVEVEGEMDTFGDVSEGEFNEYMDENGEIVSEEEMNTDEEEDEMNERSLTFDQGRKAGGHIDKGQKLPNKNRERFPFRESKEAKQLAKQFKEVLLEHKKLVKEFASLKKEQAKSLVENHKKDLLLKVLLNNTTTKSERINITESFSKAKTLSDVNALYESTVRSLGNVSKKQLNETIEDKLTKTHTSVIKESVSKGSPYNRMLELMNYNR